MNEIEKTGEPFDLQTFLSARELCLQVTQSILRKIKVGDNSTSIEKMIVEDFKAHGVTHFWHPTKVRIAGDTIKSFREVSDVNTKCMTGDLCFLDVGPIIKGHEADFGQTITIDTDESQNKLISACHSVFRQTSEAWKQNQLSGVQLLEFARTLAESFGFELNPMMAGHRLGDFPHKIFSSQKLFEWAGVPTQNLWVLEIHLVDPLTGRGAFYEDLLL